MKNILLIVINFLFLINIGFTQVKQTPGIMIGLDSTLIKMEYAHWNNSNPHDEYWEKFSTQHRIVYYCKSSKYIPAEPYFKGLKYFYAKSNVAHVYDFDDDGINIKYTTIATNEKLQYACDYLNNIVFENKYVYKFQKINNGRGKVYISNKTFAGQGIWISNKNIKDYTGCNCGIIKVIVTGDIDNKKILDYIDYCPVIPGKSGKFMVIEYLEL